MPISRLWRLQRFIRDTTKPIDPATAVKWDQRLQRYHNYALGVFALTVAGTWYYYKHGQVELPGLDETDDDRMIERLIPRIGDVDAVVYVKGEGKEWRKIYVDDVNAELEDLLERREVRLDAAREEKRGEREAKRKLKEDEAAYRLGGSKSNDSVAT